MLRPLVSKLKEPEDLSPHAYGRFELYTSQAGAIFDEPLAWPRLNAPVQAPEHAEAFRIASKNGDATLWVVITHGEEDRVYVWSHPPARAEAVHEAVSRENFYGV
ncbi:MAG: hypothetical protein ACKVPX_14835 [Myxococcaceae bacterium]